MVKELLKSLISQTYKIRGVSDRYQTVIIFEVITRSDRYNTVKVKSLHDRSHRTSDEPRTSFSDHQSLHDLSHCTIWRTHNISVTVSHRTISVIARSDGQNLNHKLLYVKSCTHTYVISRFTRKAVLCTHKSLRAHKLLNAQSRTITYTRSQLRAKDVHRTHKLTRAHKSYTYAISHFLAKVVFSTQSRLQGAKAIQSTYADHYDRF